jgi:RNA polymerase sigma-70 factor (sigma-E family)
MGEPARGRAAGGDRKLTAVLKQPRALLTRLVEVGVAPEGLGVTRSELERPQVDVPSLYVTHWRAMVRLAVLLVDDVATAEDVVQDAFVALYRRSDALRDPAAAVAYVRASVVNLSRSVVRHRQVVRRHLRVAEPDHVDGADFHALLSAEHREALAAMRELPRRQQEVLVLRFWAGLSEVEIAQTLGISAGAVKSSASRGMAKLSRKLGGMR